MEEKHHRRHHKHHGRKHHRRFRGHLRLRFRHHHRRHRHGRKHRHHRRHGKKVKSCSIYADPHVTGFSGKVFNAQTVGDWVLYRGDKLSAHYRGVAMKPLVGNAQWVGAIKFAIRIFHHKIYSTGFNLNTLKIDGEEKRVENGIKIQLGRAFILRNGASITFSTGEGEEVEWVSSRTKASHGNSMDEYFNGYVRTNVLHPKGLCSNQFVRSKFFGHPQEGKIITIKRDVCERREEFKKECERLGHGGKKLENCIFDRCSGMSRNALKKQAKEIRRKTKKVFKVKVRRHHRRHGRKHHRRHGRKHHRRHHRHGRKHHRRHHRHHGRKHHRHHRRHGRKHHRRHHRHHGRKHHRRHHRRHHKHHHHHKRHHHHHHHHERRREERREHHEERRREERRGSPHVGRR